MANISEFYQMCRHFAQARITHSPHFPGNCWDHACTEPTYAHKKTPNSKYFKTKTTMIHRFVYAVYYDTPLEQHQLVGHRCHNKRCINPLHLELTTHKDNNWRNNPSFIHKNS